MRRSAERQCRIRRNVSDSVGGGRRLLDVEVVFARGMGDPVGPGPLGAAFADSLRSKLAGRSVGVYGVNYPADVNFLRVSDGVADATNHIQWLAANCPATKVVLGGFSEGAAVVDVLAGKRPG